MQSFHDRYVQVKVVSLSRRAYTAFSQLGDDLFHNATSAQPLSTAETITLFIVKSYAKFIDYCQHKDLKRKAGKQGAAPCNLTACSPYQFALRCSTAGEAK